jgi:uncharacterized protein
VKELVGVLARALVDNPDAVHIEEIESKRGLILELSVAKEDIGKIIGKDGKTAQAIRAILNAACTKHNRRVTLDIVD